jgi:hypothetical protein
MRFSSPSAATASASPPIASRLPLPVPTRRMTFISKAAISGTSGQGKASSRPLITFNKPSSRTLTTPGPTPAWPTRLR